MVQETLSQLNTSYVDLVLLHEPCNRDSTQPHPSDQKAWNALMHAVKSGWARAIGVDKYAIPQMAALQGTRPAVLMAPMSMSQHDDVCYLLLLSVFLPAHAARCCDTTCPSN